MNAPLAVALTLLVATGRGVGFGVDTLLCAAARHRARRLPRGRHRLPTRGHHEAGVLRIIDEAPTVALPLHPPATSWWARRVPRRWSR